jgi:hypothetical protein
MQRRTLPNRTPCSITKVRGRSANYYIIIDYDPKTYEPRGLHCHGPKSGSEIWVLVNEMCPLIVRVIQTTEHPENLHRTLMEDVRTGSLISDIISTFVKEYIIWKKYYG